jgi:urea transport system substrate-binding protein
MLPNHHLTKPVLIGEIQGDGQFQVVWKTKKLVPGDAWSDYLPSDVGFVSDWKKYNCGRYNLKTKKCYGAGADMKD